VAHPLSLGASLIPPSTVLPPRIPDMVVVATEIKVMGMTPSPLTMLTVTTGRAGERATVGNGREGRGRGRGCEVPVPGKGA
jgi:hypothetical protein